MPALGMSQDTGRLIAWLKQEGDAVEKGDLLMEVETDKTTVEVEAQASGTLGGIRAQVGDDVPVGDVIAYILADGESAPSAPTGTAKTPVPEPEPEPTPTPAPAPVTRTNGGGTVVGATPVAQRMAAAHDLDLSQVPASGGRVTRADVEAYLENGGTPTPAAPTTATGIVLASPKARRLAKEQQLDLAQIVGSGPEGAVITSDVLNYTPPTPVTRPASLDTATAPSEVQTGRMWKTMAQRLTESWQTVPHFYLKRDVDAAP